MSRLITNKLVQVFGSYESDRGNEDKFKELKDTIQSTEDKVSQVKSELEKLSRAGKLNTSKKILRTNSDDKPIVTRSQLPSAEKLGRIRQEKNAALRKIPEIIKLLHS